MKNVLSFLLLTILVVFGFSSCKKNNSSIDGKNPFWTNTNGTSYEEDPLKLVGDIPGSFTKNVLIEECTAEWCPGCPKGGEELHKIVTKYPTTVYPIAVHSGDKYEMPDSKAVIALMGNPSSYPSAIFDRKETFRGAGPTWSLAADSYVTKPANVALALISETSGDNVKLKVFIARKIALPANAKVSVFLTEDKLDASGQSNAPPGYLHEHVFRGVLTSKPEGDAFSIKPGAEYTILEMNNLNISGKYVKKENLKLVVFVHTTGKAGDFGVEVLNVQGCGLNEIKKWD